MRFQIRFKKKLEHGAMLLQRYSRISFKITGYDKAQKRLSITVRQGETPHGKKCTKKRLTEIPSEFLEPLLNETPGITLRIQIENVGNKK